jgi:4'-phosphopantetheinyl transferase
VIPAASVPPAYPPKPSSLPAGEIHLWLADLDRPPAFGDAAADRWLDATERARAERLLGAREKRRFTRSRATLRRVLAGYLQEEPGELRLGAGTEGKPHLLDCEKRPRCDLRFNLSHATALWALAVRRDAEVGVDVERTDRKADVEGISRRMFSRGEIEALERLDPEVARFAFFRVWSAREALVKCLGTGMFALDLEFDVEADPARPLAVRTPAGVADPPGALPAWVGEIPLPAGTGGVLASRREPSAVRVWTVPTGGDSG